MIYLRLISFIIPLRCCVTSFAMSLELLKFVVMDVLNYIITSKVIIFCLTIERFCSLKRADFPFRVESAIIINFTRGAR